MFTLRGYSCIDESGFLSESYSVIKKLSGEEGFKYIEEDDPVTVVILNFIMRKMNGLEFLKRVCRINCVKGLMNYQNCEWDQAKKCFENSLMSPPEDGPSKIYLKR